MDGRTDEWVQYVTIPDCPRHDGRDDVNGDGVFQLRARGCEHP